MTRPNEPSGLPRGVRINRSLHTGSFPFTEIFAGFERMDVVKSIFKDDAGRVLAQLRVDLKARPGYLHVDDESGHIVVSHEYLRVGDAKHLYLDAIHELVHIKQFMEGKELFDARYSYVDRPTEIEAYTIAAREAKNIGMSTDEIIEYLKVEWVTEGEFERLLVGLGMRPHRET